MLFIYVYSTGVARLPTYCCYKLACVTIGVRLPRDMIQQDSVCGHSPLFRSPLRSLHPVMATSASGHYVIWIWGHHLSHVHRTSSHSVPPTNEVIHNSGRRGYSPSVLSPN